MIHPRNTNVTDVTKTADNVPVAVGLRVQDYDWEWGTVDNGPDIGGWWNIRLDKGGFSYMDGTRMSHRGWEVEHSDPLDSQRSAPDEDGRR